MGSRKWIEETKGEKLQQQKQRQVYELCLSNLLIIIMDCGRILVLFISILILHMNCLTVDNTENIEESATHDITDGNNANDGNIVLSRHKRYALQGSRWGVNEITYKISKYSDKLSKETVDKIIKKAFNIWSKATNLKFTQKKSEKVHIEIKFERGSHGDDAPFDGAGGRRAHAFFPAYGGDAHFDDDENWTLNQTNSNDGSRLLLVATHELGHALGIGHSEDKNALMAPSHDEWKGEVKLNSDDVKAIQALYGAPGEERPEAGDPALGRGPGPNNGGGPRGPGDPPFRGPPPVGGPPGPVPFVPGGQDGPPPVLSRPPPPPPRPRQPSPRRRPSTTSAPSFDDEDYEFILQYYRFDEDTNSVDTGGPSYPRNTGEWWFGCRSDRPRKLRKNHKNDQRFILD